VDESEKECRVSVAEFRLQSFLKNSPLKNIIFFDDEFIFSRSIEHKIIIIEKNVFGR